MSRTAWTLVAAVVAAMAAVVACTINPVTGQNQLDLMGEGQEVQIGATMYPMYTAQSLGEVPEQSLQTYVNGVGRKLTAVGHRPQLQWQFNAVNDPAVNAYALPGGKVSITRGLLSRMESEDELAAVLGHESGHVTARHSAQQYTRQMLAQLALTAGAIYMEVEEVRNRELYMLGGVFGAQLALAHYSREQERQSDDLGLAYMVAAGYNPRGMVDLHQILASQHQREPGMLERMFASHPMTSERIATARAAVEQQPAEVTSRPLTAQLFLKRTAAVRAERPAYDRLAEGRAVLGQDAERARRLFQQSTDELRDDGLLRIHLAIALFEQKKTQQAVQQAVEATEDAPRNFMVQHYGGQVFLARERWGLALAAYDRAETVLSGQVAVAYFRARAMEGLGRTREAVDLYRRIREGAAGSDWATAADTRLRGLGAA
jgi:predicted Zn-dependent protease